MDEKNTAEDAKGTEILSIPICLGILYVLDGYVFFLSG